jgi:serine protease AprX
MIRIHALVLMVLFGTAFAPAGAARAGTVGPGLARALAGAPDAPVAVWVTFTDRAGAERDPAALERASAAIPARALERRRLRGTVRGVTAGDLPVHAAYVRALQARGATLRGTSRWLNAASVTVTPRAAEALSRLPFVAGVELVPRVLRMTPIESEGETEGETETAPESAPAPSAVQLAPGDPAYYGATFKQLDLMQVPQVHAAGYTGAGVLVCILDGGCRTTHQVYSTLSVVARRDFVHGDDVVDDQVPPDAAGDASHGTYTLSAIAGSKPGTYSGVAFNCQVALGKTENVSTETPVEMDYWQMGAEWADSLGADVLSSSLGYFGFDSPYPSYVYADMDGKTTVVTNAAREAVARGITVVNAVGNEAATPWHFLIAPSDADTVIAAGAVDSFNVVTSFSSRGPSADGRIKPDVTAPGRAVYVPSFGNNTTYTRVSGTSFSCPLTAGVAALILEAHPSWGPFEVREALRETALNHAAPNNDIGWGLVQAFAAIQWVPSTTGVTPGPGVHALALLASPNPIAKGAKLTARFTATGRVTLVAYDTRGRSVARLFDGTAQGPTSVTWNGRGDGGQALGPGVYWLRLSARDALSTSAATRVVLLP